MSDNFFLPDPDNDDEILDEAGASPRDKRVVWFVLGACALGTLCICGGLGFLFVSEFVEGLRQQNLQGSAEPTEAPVPIPPLEVELRERRLADLQSGFGPAPLTNDPAIRASVETLLQQVIAATSQGDDEAFRALVDPQRLMLEVKKRGILNILYPTAEQQIVESFRTHWVTCPGAWKRYSLANVRLQGRGEEALLYVYAWDEHSSVAEVRIWISRASGVWKIYDWEILDIAMRRSLVASLAIVSSTRPEVGENFDSLRMMSQAINLNEQGDRAGALSTIQEAEKRRFIHELFDETHVTLGYVWRNLGKPRDALRAARKVHQPD